MQAHNIVLACAGCNSAKGGDEMLGPPKWLMFYSVIWYPLKDVP